MRHHLIAYSNTIDSIEAGIEVSNEKAGVSILLSYYFSRHYMYKIAVKIKPLYLTQNTYYITSNTNRVAQQ